MKLLIVSAILASAAAQYGSQYGSQYGYGSIPPSYGGVAHVPPPSYGGVAHVPPPSYGTTHRRPAARDQHSVADYSYGYAVQDPHTGVDNTKEETRLGDRTEGSYSTLLPDGRRQIVTYWVDGDSGYNAKVTYEGVAHHPPATPVRPPVIQSPPSSYGSYGQGPIY